MKALILATAMAVGFASYASAAEVKKDTKAPVIAKKAMTEQDMDKVTAGIGGAAVLTVQPPGAAIVGEFPGAADPAVLHLGQATGGRPGAGTPTATTTFVPPGL